MRRPRSRSRRSTGTTPDRSLRRIRGDRSGRSGRVDKRSIAHACGIDTYGVEVTDLVKKINKEKYLAITSAGYDEYYILPGGNSLMVENSGLSDDLVGASKAKLKSAFGKSMKGKIESRQLLNKFVKLVA